MPRSRRRCGSHSGLASVPNPKSVTKFGGVATTLAALLLLGIAPTIPRRRALPAPPIHPRLWQPTSGPEHSCPLLVRGPGNGVRSAHERRPGLAGRERAGRAGAAGGGEPPRAGGGGGPAHRAHPPPAERGHHPPLRESACPGGVARAAGGRPPRRAAPA